MELKQREQLQADLQKVVGKYKLINWGFCAEEKDHVFVGMIGKAKMSSDYMLAFVNIGRLWQYSRQSCRSFLDSYEQSP